jgi:peptidoglycan/xylan/chitin deacetylase (PgdA/CDA1 family)
MTDEALLGVRLHGIALPPAAAWADGLDIKLPALFAQMVAQGVTGWDDATRLRAREAALVLRERNAYLTRPPTSARLPINYRSVPGPLRRIIATGIGHLQRHRQSKWADFPGWPVDLSADVAADLGATAVAPPARTPVLLTHDIDSAEGLQNLVKWFLPIEEEYGARSANYIVPCAWPIDRSLVGEVRARGHEVGIHGFDHSNRTPFAPPAERTERLAAGARVGVEFGAAGYRAPSLARSRDMVRQLGDFYRYDSSVPTSGGLFPVPNNGCATARPWKIGRMWELPLSMPRDGSLRFLGYSPAQIARLWAESADLIARSRGIVCLLTHCERGFSGNPPMLAAYQSFVAGMAADSRFEFLRPVDLVDRLDQQVAAA